MAESLDVSTLQPEGPVPFDFDAARALASKLRASATLVTTQQLPRRRELASTARRDWRGNYAELGVKADGSDVGGPNPPTHTTRSIRLSR